MNVVFKNIDEIQDFINIVNKYPFDMALEREELEVGVTSILGIIYLGLEEEICLKVNADKVEALKVDIEQFVAA